MFDCLIVGLGGFIGSVLRYLIGLIGIDKTQLPIKTLIINIVGSFVIGLVVAIGLKNKDLDYRWILFLRVGICGGFTTFSSFAFENFQLFNKGEILLGVIYIFSSVMLSILAIVLSQYLVGN